MDEKKLHTANAIKERIDDLKDQKARIENTISLIDKGENIGFIVSDGSRVLVALQHEYLPIDREEVLREYLVHLEADLAEEEQEFKEL